MFDARSGQVDPRARPSGLGESVTGARWPWPAIYSDWFKAPQAKYYEKLRRKKMCLRWQDGLSRGRCKLHAQCGIVKLDTRHYQLWRHRFRAAINYNLHNVLLPTIFTTEFRCTFRTPGDSCFCVIAARVKWPMDGQACWSIMGLAHASRVWTGL